MSNENKQQTYFRSTIEMLEQLKQGLQPGGLAKQTKSASREEVIQHLTEDDENKDLRQIGLVDRQGQAWAFTGAKCYEWAGHVIGDGYACQGNILLPGTVEAMAAKYEEVRGRGGELADWLVLALEAGQNAGGDKRGRQAAGVLVVREGGGYGGDNDRYLDLRVDDHPTPIQKLKGLVQDHHLFFGEVDPDDLVPLPDVMLDLQALLIKTGHYQGPPKDLVDEQFLAALRNLVGEENLEERWNGDKAQIDQKVFDYLMNKFS